MRIIKLIASLILLTGCATTEEQDPKHQELLNAALQKSMRAVDQCTTEQVNMLARNASFQPRDIAEVAVSNCASEISAVEVAFKLALSYELGRRPNESVVLNGVNYWRNEMQPMYRTKALSKVLLLRK